MNTEIIKKIDSTIKEIWAKKLSIDYDKNYMLKEDSLKNAFYFHLRTRLGDKFLDEHNLRIFTEYYINGKRVDLVIVEIDPFAVEGNYLADCVTRVLATIEMKYKSGYVNEFLFYKDIEKIFSFIDTWGKDTKHYFAFIQETYFKMEEIEHWVDNKKAAKIKGKITELYAYWDENSDKTFWSIIDY